MASFYSSLITLLILVAVLSTPASAEDRKLRKSGEGHRKLGKAMKGAKCMKNTNYDGCVGVVFGPLYGVQPGATADVVNYGTGKFDFSGTKRETLAIAVGTEWISSGGVADPETLSEEGEVIGPNTNPLGLPLTDFENADYYFYIQCKVLRGKIKTNTNGDLKDSGEKVPLVCHIDICYGVGFSEEDVPDCLVLRGLTKGNLAAKGDEQLTNVEDFAAGVVTGIGRFTGVVGYGEVMPSSEPGGANPNDIPGGSNGKSWQIDLYVGESPWFRKEKVPLPDKLNWDEFP